MIFKHGGTSAASGPRWKPTMGNTQKYEDSRTKRAETTYIMCNPENYKKSEKKKNKKREAKKEERILGCSLK